MGNGLPLFFKHKFAKWRQTPAHQRDVVFRGPVATESSLWFHPSASPNAGLAADISIALCCEGGSGKLAAAGGWSPRETSVSFVRPNFFLNKPRLHLTTLQSEALSAVCPNADEIQTLPQCDCLLSHVRSPSEGRAVKDGLSRCSPAKHNTRAKRSARWGSESPC